MRHLALLTAFCLTPLPTSAAPSADRCAGIRIPEPWTSWTQSGDADAGGDTTSAPRLILGKPTVATLRPTAQVQYAAKPANTLPKSHGGLFALALKNPARIGIGLSGPASVDIVSGQSVQEAVDRNPGPHCSGIDAITWFDLQPGKHWVQLSDSPSPQLRLMVADAMANQPIPKPREDAF